MILLVYVDDIVLTCSKLEAIDEFKESLNKKFKLKDLGQLKYFLGLAMQELIKEFLLIKGSMLYAFVKNWIYGKQTSVNSYGC